MRFESVTAHHFGPLHNRTLDLSPAMNVIYGPNEAGKSSWHAALYAGLCGMRRGRGQPLREDREFAKRHRPWDDNSAWEVGAIVALEDGRHVELRHDFAGKVGCSARDADIAGRDYSSTIIFEGAPDGSRWLGLNRKSFLSTACIQQADIIRILNDAASLQQDMQRAADTAGVDATAAAALQRLNDFRATHVGSTQAPKRPLLTSANAVRQAKDALESARRSHDDYLKRRAEVEGLERGAHDAQRRANAVGAVLAEAKAGLAEQRLQRACELTSLFPNGAPHPSLDHDALAEQVTEALTTWRNRPSLAELAGPTTEDFDQMIADSEAKLTATRAAVAEREAEEAERRLERANELAACFPDGAPRPSAADENLAVQVVSALNGWASLPAAREPDRPSVEEIERELEEFDASVSNAAAATPQTRRLLPLLGVSLLAIVGGIVIAVALPDLVPAGATLAVAGLAGALGWWAMTRLNRQSVDARSDAILDIHRSNIVRQLELRRQEQDRYESDLQHRDDVLTDLREATAACGSDAVEPEAQAQALHDWQYHRNMSLRARDELNAKWDELQGLVAGQSLEEIGSEAKQLRDRANTLMAAADRSLLDDARRQNIAGDELTHFEREAHTQRNKWEHEHGERRAAEEQRQKDAEQVEAAADVVRRAAKAAEVAADDEDGLVEALEKWQEARKESIARAGERGRDWDELQQLLGDSSLDEMAVEVASLREDATARASMVGDAPLASARAQQPSWETLAAFEEKVRNAHDDWNAERVRLEEFANTLASVADAEDALAAAEREQARVAQLDRTLNAAINLLKDAQEQVHRNIAPILKATVLEWLPQATNARYTDCRIDPQNLMVEVSGADGRWRDATLLSHGTAEQVYLLLRLAMARHLTAKNEVCPLILDDVVSASDAERKRVVLETLLSISESTQVILFTHEDDVRDWAQERLNPPAHRLNELARDSTPA